MISGVRVRAQERGLEGNPIQQLLGGTCRSSFWQLQRAGPPQTTTALWKMKLFSRAWHRHSR